MRDNLETGFVLDRRWHLLEGEMDTSKKPDLLALAQILDREHVPYAIIGGIAVQVHRHEPRTTLDVDVAVRDRSLLPRAALLAAGFRETGRIAFSENWEALGGTPIQFTDDAALADAVARAESLVLDGVPLRILAPVDLLHAKLRAGSAPSRRRSKRLQDLADAIGLLEERPELDAALSDAERAALDVLR